MIIRKSENPNKTKVEFWRWEGRGQDPNNDQNGATLEFEDASKNDWGWLLSDLRWFVGFSEKG